MGKNYDFAKRELEIAGYYDEDSDYNGTLPEAVLEIVKVFETQGHSGMSASIVINILSKVLRFEPLTELTGEEDEWNLVENGFQNNRDSSVFKDENGENPEYIYGVLFRDENGRVFSGQVLTEDGQKIASSQPIKFPFYPKTYYLNTRDNEDGWPVITDPPEEVEKVLSNFNYKE